MVEEYKDRLAQAMKDKGVTTAQLANDLKISYQAVRKALLGGQFGTDNNIAAARRLEVRSEWLATGRGPKKPTEQEVSQWPFSPQLRSKVVSLREPEIRSLEVAMWVHLREEIPRHLLSTPEVGVRERADEALARKVLAESRHPAVFTESASKKRK